MADGHLDVSAFDCDILRTAFIPEDQWRTLAASLIRDLTGHEDIDPDMLDWITRK
ncbi:hypothetical protein [Mesorhizobium waimense]|uniref:hypothetical protein n=1 Tax=Mesorhizobium waimense TaxID=1300307 RepID=UPI00142DE093|nr:hypothetical protein [Mesorhizobium waimense]